MLQSDFYPRPPCGGRHVRFGPLNRHGVISIHALRVEGDCSCRSSSLWLNNFYPRPPCGGRRFNGRAVRFAFDVFLSTPSVWRATGSSMENVHLESGYFYPRPPCGGRRPCRCHMSASFYFYPRPPCGGRLYEVSVVTFPAYISIHALRVEGDSCPRCHPQGLEISIHALRVEGDGQFCVPAVPCHTISIHALRVEGDLCKGRKKTEDIISIHALRVEGDFSGG